MADSGVMRGPAVKRPPCVHDSTRIDGFLDVNCLRCGAPGYWREGEQVVTGLEIHPSGKVLVNVPAPDVKAALAILRAAAEVDGTEAIYLHLDGTKPSFGLFLRGDQKLIAENALERAGKTYDHSHIDGDD